MIDFDELERLMRAAEAPPLTGDSEYDAILSFARMSAEDDLSAALRNAAPKLIAMARRYQWLRDEAWNTSRAAPAVCMVDGAGRPFLCRETRYVEPILEGSSLDEAIDAAMQEQKPSEAERFGMDLASGCKP